MLCPVCLDWLMRLCDYKWYIIINSHWGKWCCVKKEGEITLHENELSFKIIIWFISVLISDYLPFQHKAMIYWKMKQIIWWQTCPFIFYFYWRPCAPQLSLFLLSCCLLYAHPVLCWTSMMMPGVVAGKRMICIVCITSLASSQLHFPPSIYRKLALISESK